VAPLYRTPDGPDPLQGDVYDGLPFLLARSVPISIMRPFREGKKGPMWVQYEDGGEQQPEKTPIHLGYQEGGDDVLAIGFKAPGIVLSHDCEIVNAPDHVLLAPIIPWSNLAPEHQVEAERGERLDVFPLMAQDDEPAMAKSYVKFPRLTAVHQHVLRDCPRRASSSDRVRRALAAAFHRYLFHPELESSRSA
jgi:hypothetical protein